MRLTLSCLVPRTWSKSSTRMSRIPQSTHPSDMAETTRSRILARRAADVLRTLARWRTPFSM
ncbi:MAG: hypothetical protein ABT06_12355 [Leifsonia sp. SCN 70-46]|nr:MAG: hypothetical protein ABT06_12355 [Leifsonia sp. SCN 70-46]